MTLTTQDQRQVAQTIIAQFGGGMFVMMTGSKNFFHLPQGGVQFDIGRNPESVTRCVVTLRSDDTYDVILYRGRGLKIRAYKTFEGVYADSLRSIFEGYTGLCTSL